MKKLYLITIAILIWNCLYSQTEKTIISRENIEGVWVNDEEQREYFIVKGNIYVNIYDYDNKPANIRFWRYGFISNKDYNEYHIEKNSCIPINLIKDSSRYIVVYMDENYPEKGCLEISKTLYYGYIIDNPNSSDISLEYTHLIDFHRTSLPKEIEKRVIDEFGKKGLVLPRTYVYTDWEHCCRVNAEKAMIYSKPESLTKMYFIKGDCLKILEEHGGWLKIDFVGKKNITGWVMKNDVKIIR